MAHLQRICFRVFQAMPGAVRPVRPCTPTIFKIYSPLMPRRFPSLLRGAGLTTKNLHQNVFSENIFLVSSHCRACTDEVIPGGYMKGVKAEKLKSAKYICKVFLVPLQPLQPLATFCYSVIRPCNAVP